MKKGKQSSSDKAMSHTVIDVYIYICSYSRIAAFLQLCCFFGSHQRFVMPYGKFTEA